VFVDGVLSVEFRSGDRSIRIDGMAIDGVLVIENGPGDRWAVVDDIGWQGGGRRDSGGGDRNLSGRTDHRRGRTSRGGGIGDGFGDGWRQRGERLRLGRGTGHSRIVDGLTRDARGDVGRRRSGRRRSGRTAGMWTGRSEKKRDQAQPSDHEEYSLRGHPIEEGV
jgi:hypothetical protein